MTAPLRYFALGSDLFAGRMPHAAAHVEALDAAGVRTVVNLCEEHEYWEGERAAVEAAFRRAGIVEHRLPVHDGATIPVRYTCVGDNQSPPLAWRGVPPGAAELAVVVDDPDAPQGTFVHWVLTGLAPARTALDAGERPPAAVEARGSSGETGYTGPCPPNHQTHRYRFTVYALRAPAGVAPGAPFSTALSALQSRALASGTLTAKFGR